MKWSLGTHGLASQGHDALNVHLELLKPKEWRTALAGYTFVIFVTQGGSCGYSVTPRIMVGFLMAFLSLINRARE